MTTTARRVGYIGLGNLGFHLAHSLLKAGHQLTITDLSKDLAEPLLAKGATWATSAKEVAERSDVVFTCLPSPKVIDTVVLGENGILAGSHDGMIWIDNSTNDQDETIRLSGIAAARGVRMLESPVTGGVHKAAAGDITVLVAGEDTGSYEVFLQQGDEGSDDGDRCYPHGTGGHGSAVVMAAHRIAHRGVFV